MRWASVLPSASVRRSPRRDLGELAPTPMPERAELGPRYLTTQRLADGGLAGEDVSRGADEITVLVEHFEPTLVGLPPPAGPAV
jgi:hypothetical protein